MKDKTVVEYCMECGDVNPQDKSVCKCGGKNFVFGSDFEYKNKGVTCNCGSDMFKMIAHINRSPYYDKTYRCKECGNIIGVQNYHNSYINDK